MLSLLFYKVINTVFNKISVPAIIILFITILISTSVVYKSLSSSY